MSSQAIARNIVQTRYDDLPADVREVTKRSIIDTLGVMLPPTTLEKACIALYKLVKEAGGKKESTLVGFGGKVPCWMAAFVNGSLAHAIDYDDGVGLEKPLIHPTGSTFPACLAIAERIGGVSGKDFITAIALGNDLDVRLAACPKGDQSDLVFTPMASFGVLAAAAASGKLLGLSEAEMLNALGLAFHRVAGAGGVGDPDSDLRAIRDGFTNKEGALSALMASRGIAASKDAVERLLDIDCGGDYDSEPLTSELGKKFRGVEAGFKPWPCCGGTHGCVQVALQVIKEHNIKPEQIEEVMLTVTAASEHFWLPLEARQEPTSSIFAKSSIPFVVAVALVKGNVAISHFLPQNLKDPDVLKMAKKIKHKVDPTFGIFTPTQVEIKTKDGKSYSSRVDILRGQLKNPLSMEEIITKFKDCASYSKKRLSSVKIDRLITSILELEKVGDIREITDILA